MFSIILRFVGIGTFVGGGVFPMARSVASMDNVTSLSELALIPVIAGLAWFMSLPFGFLPASAAGISYWYFLSRHTKSNPPWFARSALAGCIGLVIAGLYGLMFSFSGAPGAPSPVASLITWSCTGAIASAVSALAVRDATYAQIFGHRTDVVSERVYR